MPNPTSSATGTLVTIPRLGALTGSAAAAAADAVVIGVHAGPDTDAADGPARPVLAAGAEDVDAAFGGGLVALLATVGATGKAEQVVKLPAGDALGAPLLVAVGLGKAPDDGSDDGPDADLVRRGAGAAARALAGTGHVVSTLSAVHTAAAVEGAVLGGYTFDAFRSEPDPSSSPAEVIEFTGTDDDAVRRAGLVAEAVCTARELVNTPPSDLYPETFAARAAELGSSAGLTVEVLDEVQLRDGGYGGVTGVGQGSSRGPRLVRLSWSGGPSPSKKVALVGKGITFDTGGISIKPAANMDHMTSDMGGAAAVIATTVLAARLELPVAVTATVPMAENMPSDTAYRPGDVLRMYGGKTVEVLNTDAEGRLILADAIVRAGEDSPDYLVETSTLTGAQQVALGMRTMGVMGSDAFPERVAGLARDCGEDGWAMPLPGYLRSDLDSRVADIANVTGQRYAGMLVAGVFLREFVPSGLAWAHLDIAGPSFNASGARGYTTKGGTGVPVRTLHALLEDIAANG